MPTNFKVASVKNTITMSEESKSDIITLLVLH